MLRHDLLEEDEARAVLQMPQQKFEGLVISGQLRTFRSDGRVCFRRDDVAALARKLSGEAKKAAPAASASAAKAASNVLSTGIIKAAPPPVPATPPKQRNRAYWLVGVLGAAALGMIATMVYQLRRPQAVVSVKTPLEALHSEAPFAKSVVAPGRVESVSGVLNLAFEVTGTIKSVSVVEGQRVKAGEIIAELENDDVKANLAAAQADLAAAEANYKVLGGNLESELIRAQRQVDSLQADLKQYESGYRTEEIAKAKADAQAAEADAKHAEEEKKRYFDPTGRYDNWSKQLYDQAMRQAESAEAKHQSAQALAREMEAGYREEDKAKARAALASAQADLNRVVQTKQARLDAAQAQTAQTQASVKLCEANLKKTRLAVPRDGVVVWQFLHTGETVTVLPPTPVVAMADTQNLRVRADVDEADYPNIAPGQRVKVNADAFPGKYFDGDVETVCASAGAKNFSTGEAKERQDVKIIETVVKLAPGCPLKLGLRVTAYFELK